MSPASDAPAPARPPLPTCRRHPGRSRPRALAWAAALLLAPLAARGAALAVEGGPLVLGRTERASLLVEVAEAPGEARPLRLSASAGALAAPERLGPGRYRVAYTPPATRFPQVALVAIWREGAPEAAEVVRLPLHGTARRVVKAPPGRTVTVEAGEARFGPVAAGEDGRAAIGLVVAPGVERAQVTIDGGKRRITRTVALEVPPASGHVKVPVAAAQAATSTPTATATATATPTPTPTATSTPTSTSTSTSTPTSTPTSTSTSTSTPTPTSTRTATPTATAPEPPPEAAEEPRDAALLLGARVGYVHAFGDAAGARFGVDGWWPFRAGGLPVAMGLSASYGQAAPDAGPACAAARATLVPLTVRVAYQAQRGDGSIAVGASGTVALARISAGAAAPATGAGAGAGAFAAGLWAAGPGQLFVEASLGSVPVSGGGYQLEAGGFGLEVGYRFRIE